MNIPRQQTRCNVTLPFFRPKMYLSFFSVVNAVGKSIVVAQAISVYQDTSSFSFLLVCSCYCHHDNNSVIKLMCLFIMLTRLLGSQKKNSDANAVL
jgi:hypothetical protein